ncbi:MAG: HAD-IIIC family phosphatase [Lentisphaerales bacterium]|nr:MAG: HAD-IIIC family phosphatase [Lentisphaerales bacterium]
MGSEIKCLVISDSVADNFAALLRNDENLPRLNVTTAPYDQVRQVLLDEDAECWQSKKDVAVVWTRPQAVIPSFRDLSEGREVSVPKTLEEVDEYCDALKLAAGRARALLVPTWSIPDVRAFSLLDMTTGIGTGNMIMRMNLRLAENLEKEPGIHVLSSGAWITRAGPDAFSDKLWYMAKVPFSNEVYKAAVVDIKSALRAIAGDSRKLILLDLDDTLWGGIVGDVGWENVVLGGHDHIGEAYRDFQLGLKAFAARGILLGIVSKNEETVALEAIEKHPEMVLRREDFAGWRINWRDKAENIVELVKELNLGLQSVVFIDDNPMERARVREALPEVLVPEWPTDRTQYRRALLDLDCFNAVSIGVEDRQRTDMYRAETERRGVRKEVGSFEDWLKTLGVRVTVGHLSRANLARVEQLLNKTNQMNLRTRRMTAEEIPNWASGPGRVFLVFTVSDRFGDSGLTGILSLEEADGSVNITDFVLSCRVMGRRVEEAMVHIAVEYARRRKLSHVRADFVPTARNKPCHDFWLKSGFEQGKTENLFTWSTERSYPAPDGVEIRQSDPVG